MTTKTGSREAAKASTLRVVVPDRIKEQVLKALGPMAKAETRDLDLATGRLTTYDVVRYIKRYTKIRDELIQTLRQLGIARNPKSSFPKLSELDSTLEKGQTMIRELQSEYKNTLTEVEVLERQAQEATKQVNTVEQLAATGFSYDEVATRMTGFRRILGRLPSKRLEPAQKAVRALLKDTTVMSTGATRNNWVYLLVACPTDLAAQTLQTLLLYDFTPADMPNLDGSNLKEALRSWEEKRDRLDREIEMQKSKVNSLRQNWAEVLNNLADGIQETLLLLRSSLRLGEGAKTTHIFVRLEVPPPAEILNELMRDGILELD